MLQGVAHRNMVRFHGKVRDLFLRDWDKLMMEGDVDGIINVLEIDECIFGKKQIYNLGHRTRKQWVYGMVERNTRKHISSVWT